MSVVDTMTEDEIRNTAEFAEWLTRYNKLNHADLTTKTAPYYLLIDYLSTLVAADEIDKVDDLTAENAKLREQLAEAVGLLQELPDMMGGDNWGDFLTLDDERRVLGVIDAK